MVSPDDHEDDDDDNMPANAASVSPMTFIFALFRIFTLTWMHTLIIKLSKNNRLFGCTVKKPEDFELLCIFAKIQSMPIVRAHNPWYVQSPTCLLTITYIAVSIRSNMSSGSWFKVKVSHQIAWFYYCKISHVLPTIVHIAVTKSFIS